MYQNPSARTLSQRDPAMAALMGGIANNGADFGADFGYDTRTDFGNDIAADIAAEFGDEVAQAVTTSLARRAGGGAVENHPVVRQAHHTMRRIQEMQMHTHHRAMLLDPNKYSTIKVEEYELPMHQVITIGTLATFTDLSTTPQTEFKPTALVCNAPIPGFAFIQDIKAANVSASVSNFVTDAYNYNANATRSRIHLPRLLPQTTVSITGQYTGAIPPGVLAGTSSYFTATLYGPSTLAGG